MSVFVVVVEVVGGGDGADGGVFVVGWWCRWVVVMVVALVLVLLSIVVGEEARLCHIFLHDPWGGTSERNKRLVALPFSFTKQPGRKATTCLLYTSPSPRD